MESPNLILSGVFGLVFIGALSLMIGSLVKDPRTVAIFWVRAFATVALMVSLTQILVTVFWGHYWKTQFWALLCMVWVGLLLLRRWAAVLVCGMVGSWFLWNFWDAVEEVFRQPLTLPEALSAGLEMAVLVVLVGLLHYLGPRLHPGL